MNKLALGYRSSFLNKSTDLESINYPGFILSTGISGSSNTWRKPIETFIIKE